MYYRYIPFTKAYSMKTSTTSAKPPAFSKEPTRRQGRPAAPAKSVTIQVRMSAEEASLIRARAEMEDRPISNFIRKLLRQAVTTA